MWASLLAQRFFNQAGGFVVGLAQDFLIAQLGFRELLLDLLSVVLAFLDAAAALIQHLQNRAEGVGLQNEIKRSKTG